MWPEWRRKVIVNKIENQNYCVYVTIPQCFPKRDFMYKNVWIQKHSSKVWWFWPFQWLVQYNYVSKKKIFTNLHRMEVLKKFLIYIFKKEISSLLYWIWRGKNRKKNINPDCLRTSISTILSYKSTEFSSILNSNKVLYENSQRHKN